ncbi:MAG: 4-alpha-glucanotransferase, partial [Acidimicrobiales bacterium]|nr:4-alpha-glucanotransferase [Acidimicrobiales bacterium]
PPAAWPVSAMGAVTTHDLPTVAGVVTGSDVHSQLRLGLEPNEESSEALLSKVRARTGTGPDTPVEEVTAKVYADLAAAPCLLLAASLEDALQVGDRPNMPGTPSRPEPGGWPNWSMALPAALEDLEEAPLVHEIADHLSRHGNS